MEWGCFNYSLKDESLIKIKFKENKILNEKYMRNIGRIRDIELDKKSGRVLLSDTGSL